MPVGAGGRIQPITKVLLVDDEEAQLSMWTLQLRKLNVTPLTASDRKTALELARTERPQVAIIDLVLGNESGIDVARGLRELDHAMYLHVASSWAGLHATLVLARLCNDISHKPIDAARVVKVASGIPLDREIDRYPTLADVEREHIARALREHHGNIVHAAEALGLYPNSLRRKMERHGLRARARALASDLPTRAMLMRPVPVRVQRP